MNLSRFWWMLAVPLIANDTYYIEWPVKGNPIRSIASSWNFRN